MTIIDRAELLAVTRSSAPHRLVYGSEPNGFSRAHIPGSVTFASPADAMRVRAGANDRAAAGYPVEGTHPPRAPR